MCGIIGMVSSAALGFTNTHSKVFSNLLWTNTLRGDDSTGVFGVESTGNVEYLKSTGDAAALMKTKEFDEFDTSIYRDFQMVVGHNRKATRGMVTDENAHPFVEDTMILVHNGTLTNHAMLTDEYISVDSKAILMHMKEHGYEETLKTIQGAFTLVWYDTKDKTLRAIRNEERPLFIASTIGAWFFASEKEMLQFILGREGVDIVEMTNCKPGTMYSWNVDDIDNMWYKPVELWSPPRESVIKLLPAPTNEKKSETTYANTDFPINSKLLIQAKRIQEFPKATQQGHSGILYGAWYFDENVHVRCWLSKQEIDNILVDIDEDDSEINEVFQATIDCVMSKKNKITLIMSKPTKYKPILDSDQKEIFEDEFIFTRQQCDDCNKSMSFEDASKGKLIYKSEQDYNLYCETCK